MQSTVDGRGDFGFFKCATKRYGKPKGSNPFEFTDLNAKVAMTI